MSVPVNEAYRDWKPPAWVRPTVCRLLEGVDSRYSSGLDAVVLTNVGALNSQRKRGKTWSRRHKVSLAHCRGLYHPRHQSQGAWIEVFVDQVLKGTPSWICAVPLLRELHFADTLFHELGHHIHRTQAPEFREREDVADAWRLRLGQEMFRTRHPHLRLALRPFRPLISVAKRFIGRHLSRTQKKSGNNEVAVPRRSAT